MYGTTMATDALSQARHDYLENQVLSSSPTEIVQKLYQVAIDNVQAAIRALKDGEALPRARAVTKAEEAVDELLLALDHSVGAQFTRTLADLYRYILHQLVLGHARQSEQAFRDALTILESLADTWSQVRSKLNAEAEAASGAAASLAGSEPAQASIESDRRASDPYAAYSGGSPVTPGRDWSA